MKKILQFVALFAVVLLAAQPALAGMPCTGMERACSHRASCCEGMDGMEMGMAECQPTASLSSASSCNCGWQEASAQLPDSSRAEVFPAVALISVPLTAALPALFSSEVIPADSPPSCADRCVLFQVFRI